MTKQNQLALPSTLREDLASYSEAFTLSNHPMQITSVILDEDGKNPLVVSNPYRELFEILEETYVINSEHRTALKNGKGKWTISEEEEMRIFSQMRYIGAFRKWQPKGNGYVSHKGWGLYLPNIHNNVSPEVLGQSYNDSKEVKVCEFREHEEHEWHGFPIDYTDHKTERIHDNALGAWVRLGIIKKNHIPKIKQKREVKPLCV